MPSNTTDEISWDSGAVSGAVVRRFVADNSERWIMWYGGRPEMWAGADRAPPGLCDAYVGIATSDDGRQWTRLAGPRDRGAILEPNADDWWWFDTAHISLTDVDITSNALVRSDGGVYFAYYSGGDNDSAVISGVEVFGMRTRIGVALSKDGENWTRVEGPFSSGAVLEFGEPGSFDALGVAGPSVIRFPKQPAGSRLNRTFAGRPEHLMYYYAYDPVANSYAIGRAHSVDGFEFKRDNNVDGSPIIAGSGIGSGLFDECGYSHSCIVQRGPNDFVMFVTVIDGAGRHRIATCHSNDAFEWSPRTVILDLPVHTDAWDAGGVSHPCAVVVDECVSLFYTGRGASSIDAVGKSTTGIGTAVSQGSDWTAPFIRR
jgi:hypothetical protein